MRLTYSGLQVDPQTFQPHYLFTETETGRKLARLSPEAVQDAYAFHGIDLRNEILLAVKQEIERQIGELSEEEINFIDSKIPSTIVKDADDGN